MIKVKLISTILLISVLAASPALSQNPFTGKDHNTSPVDTAVPSLSQSFLTKITLWQLKLKQKIAGLIRRAKTERNLKPLAALLLIAFTYGPLHAAGPGHGKAVAASYTLSRRQSLAGGLLFGNLIALSHGLSGALLVVLLRFVLESRVMSSLNNVSRTTQLISYALIGLLGMGIMGHTLWDHFKKAPSQPIQPASAKPSGSMITTALAVGMVPCPGIVMIMLFCLSMNMLGLGLLLSAFMSAGMALTISLVVIVTLTFRKVSLQAFSGRRQWADRVELALELISGLLMTLLGLLFFYAAL
jgi:ABC-type nickel/cobalt efflux system permease component RcnA